MKKFALEIRIMQLCVIASIFSQIETLSKVMRPIMIGMWGVVFIYYLIKYNGKIVLNKSTLVYIGCYWMLLIGSITMTVFGTNHLNGNYIHIMYIPLLASIVGEFYLKDNETEKLQIVLWTYLVGAVVYAGWVNINYFSSYSEWLDQNVYTFMLKNSAAQIWSMGILIAAFLLQYKTILQKIIGYGMACYLLLLCGISQCRTALLALAVMLVIFVLLKSNHKIRWSIIIIICCAFVWINPITKKFIDQALFLTKYAGTDLNTFSSGRLVGWERALDRFSQSPIFGCGKYYVDCSYISILAEVGIVGFILIEAIWGVRIYTNLKMGINVDSRAFLLCATVFYFVESILEGYPPFGPGVSSFMFWFLSAVCTNEFQEGNKITVGDIN